MVTLPSMNAVRPFPAALVSRLVLLSCALMGLQSTSSAAQLKVGVASTDVTPPVGYRMSGYFYERPSTGIHDPLFAKVLYLKQGSTEGALVFCDMIGVPRTLTDAARLGASKKTGIPVSHILIAATHSH